MDVHKFNVPYFHADIKFFIYSYQLNTVYGMLKVHK